MFKNEMVKKNHSTVIIGNFRCKVLQELFRFIYTGEVCEAELEDIICDLLACGEIYQVKDLKKLCEKKMSNSLTKVNAIEYYRLSVLYKANYLESSTSIYIGLNLKHFIKKQEFINLTMEHQGLLFDITKKYFELKNCF